MAAERICLTIPAGERHSHRLLWRCSSSEGAGEDAGEGQAEGGCGGGGRLSGLEWSVVVLDERLVDLEVLLHFGAPEPDGKPECEWIQERASGRVFRGSFTASDHPRAGKAEPELPEAVVFEFNNSYSWLTPKDVELIIVRHEEEPASRPPAPLPALRPASPPRRRGRCEEDWLQPPELPKLGHFDRSAGVGALHAKPLAASCRAEAEVVALAARLDAWLAAAEAEQPTRLEDVAEVLVGISELRGMCKQKLSELLPAA